MEAPKSLFEAAERFSCEDWSLAYFCSKRWPDGVRCPDCSSEDVGLIKTRKVWKCRACKRQFSAKVGTVMEDSPIPLGRWLFAMWLVANAKNGVSTCEVARCLGITQKSAWHMVHRIREAMAPENPRMLSGQVEADETYIGGRYDPRRKSHGDGPHYWAVRMPTIFGMKERGSGGVRAHRIPGPTASDLTGQVRANVWPGTELFTDNAQQYIKLRKEYIHRSVSHSTYQWAIGDIHTNGIENFWCLLKRSIKGTWVRPSPKHIDRFVTDQVFRFNMRGLDDSGRFDTVASRATGKRLTWKKLVG